MKRLIVGSLGVAIFFVGLGALVDKVGARFKSDEKALELVRKARQAIGGDSAITGVKSLRIVGQTTRNIKVDGVSRSETGETEIAMQLPDKLMKMVKIGHDDGTGSGETKMTKQVDVVVVGEKGGTGIGSGTGAGEGQHKIFITKGDGQTEELNGPDGSKVIVRRVDGGNAEFKVENGTKVTSNEQQVFVKRDGGEAAVAGARHEAMRHNEMLRMTLGLLMSAPEGMDVSYTYGGEGDVDGTACNIVVAGFGDSSFKIYLSKSSDLPVMMSYKGMREPTIVRFRTAEPTGNAEPKEKVFFTSKVDGPVPDTAEFNVKFSDYRSVDGVQLPYKWTQTVGGADDETFDVTSYEINPANIAEKFNNQNVMVRIKRPDGQ